MADIVLDFDGVLTKKDCWPEIRKPSRFAIWVVKKLHKWNHNLILCTSREDEMLCGGKYHGRHNLLKEALIFLNFYGIYPSMFGAINDNLECRIMKYGSNCRKVTGTYLIDDMACTFPRVRLLWLFIMLNPIMAKLRGCK